jgi:hypothetical protein
MELGYRLIMDDSGEYLTVDKSYVTVYAADDDEAALFRYDYERGKSGYPEAHLQVFGESAALAAWTGSPRRQLDRLHFPTGGRRYRPALEDVIEFLVVEGLTDGRAGWLENLNASRHKYWRRQLSAAIRRDPVTALEVVREMALAS